VEHIIRLAMMAGTGAGMAGLRRLGVKLAWFLTAGIAVCVLSAGAVGFFGFAIYTLLEPQVGTAGAAAIVGLGLLIAAAIVWFGCRAWYAGRRRLAARFEAGPSLGSAFGAGLGGGPDIANFLSRNATSVMLAAFVAGMLMNRRR